MSDARDIEYYLLTPAEIAAAHRIERTTGITYLQAIEQVLPSFAGVEWSYIAEIDAIVYIK